MRIVSVVLLLVVLASRTDLAQSARVVPTSRFGTDPGEELSEFALKDVRQRPVTASNGLVLVTFDTECPVSQRYAGRIREMARAYHAKGFQFVVVDVTPHDLTQARSLARNFPETGLVLDTDKDIVSRLGARSTAEAFVIDPKRTLRYRGAIDDQYGLSRQLASPTEHWLKEALDATLRGENPEVRKTRADGCPLAVARGRSETKRPITYHNRVSRIIQDNCQICHRIGGLGPMPLENYRQVYERRAIIDVMVSSNRMPPWFADPDVGNWSNDRSLSTRDKADLLAWARGDAPEGRPEDAPLPRHFPAGWNIGAPDAVIRIPAPIKVPAHGAVAYKYVFVKTNFPDDKWVSAVEIRPTQPSVVHHVIILTQPGDRPPQIQGTTGGFFATTVPGFTGIVFPEGTAKKIPKGAWIQFEIHYQPNGREVVDRTEVGFKFAKGPVRELESRSVADGGIDIPPNDPAYISRVTVDFDRPGQLVAFFPHMHLRGAAFRYDLKLPDGRIVPLLNVPKFDFNWQTYYKAATPIDVQKGAKLIATARYDNSKNNPWNPDPSKEVRWGLQSYDEMMIGYFEFLPAPVRASDVSRRNPT